MTVSAMSAKELHDKMNSGKSVFILDVRNPDDYNDWKIEHRNLVDVNIPYFDFLDDNEDMYNPLPKDTEIVIVCAKGGSAKMVAEMVDKRGYTTSYLEEGMLEWSQFYHTVTVVDEPKMKIIQVNRLAKGCLSYMVMSNGKAMVVDPGRHYEEYLKLAKEERVQITHIMDTHLHADHISGAPELAKQTGASYHISRSEMQGSDIIPYHALEDKQTFQIGDVDVKVMAIPTPGHTPGSVSFLVQDRYLLSGDTIFVGGLGRPDLGGKAREWAQSLYDTVFTHIENMNDDTLVLPTHYTDLREVNEQGIVGAKLGEIREKNQVMRTKDRELFTEMVAGTSGATPPNYDEILKINRGDVQVPLDVATELEIGPNRCAIHHS
ncbi:glyoxylase-like metal-dependent hydrolase (beta-lactamase superfamily II) [Aneurinibacillus soli]|uniref:Putative polyketide biosynthesis zinc-dependent hydrolase BaeB n=1 Tax=Aneurinibacillus soli TaxID=1500254 RepID=A0A0U4WHE0_9BACL|nr:MBL fold metallo-hydrolase [Aneurinibacillus soli]PYE64124.1 glyoxylase-like metal-dependent hydrolase (beta-lactamase superfamily II) [Aneurinibacillus soli]BAU28073.1 putative polyketide biosynthesis zinc-dependent hydrolase BaeB [Aneurinibacillus soli]